MKPLSVLIADDEENISTLVQICLTAAGHRSVCVENARQAKEQLANTSFDLVITDILMPDGDGLDLIAQVKKVQPQARILAMSGGGRYMESDDCLKMARGLGAHAVVMKPFDRAKLLAGVEQAMRPLSDRSDAPEGV